ncbi:hypothetical protein, variant [Blastomyces dermatitidis ER-3]|uniref:Uncharacterized protein n=3 Tax=Blastomyces TaxID=229219 RepID=A0A179UYQ6_BLAGS|nr:hypothetical protein, variant [Blastomyces gilchristii SLH14081]XP_045281133.1 hypothetical protein, variant [Blastomyces dermatitidis ER-3]EQL37704.1 hypothetical protein, variant [Blastomyces dermatitidis ATCC 26199]KMW68735.1 hypothetical protein, variant [Blastomyces dermatitidis ATCC 18188]OAT01406.1 hypothetical protein, variant [Blastomyces dermatitidis ER-3]OAT12953.1 hypothetical protein, variant [Blastomyces gilchristii SLH14081]
MTPSQDWNSCCPPSQPQLALALAIVKSKPSNTTIKDHILKIRRHIQNGKAYHAPELPEKHLDSITFWREAYEMSESAQSKLLDKIYELEQRNAALLLKGGESNASETNAPRTKRKINGDGDSTVLSHAQKRAKTTKNGRLNTSRPQSKDFLSGTADELGFSEISTPFLRHFHALQKQLQRKINHEALVSLSVGLCEAIDITIRSRIGDKRTRSNVSVKQKTLQPREPGLQHVLKGICPSYPLLLQTLNKLSDSDDAGSGIGVLTYHIIQLFQKTLGHMHQYIISKGKESIAQGIPAGKKGKQRSKTKMTKTPASPLITSDEELTLNLFSHFLASMILSLNPVKPQENSLLEGFLFSILEKVGRTLCLFVFKELYSNSDLRLNPAKLPMPGNFDKEYPARGEMAIAQRAAECEARHLIWILERAIAFTDQFERPSDVINGDLVLPETTLPKGPPSEGILQRAKTKLQNTLLKGIFGENEPKFRDSLKVPEKPSYSLPEVSSGRSFDSAATDPAEWFTQEVWRLIGWDVLLDEK